MTSSRPDPGEILSNRVGGLRSGPIEPLNLVRPCPELIECCDPRPIQRKPGVEGQAQTFDGSLASRMKARCHPPHLG
jgi:hypothetical protein